MSQTGVMQNSAIRSAVSAVSPMAGTLLNTLDSISKLSSAARTQPGAFGAEESYIAKSQKAAAQMYSFFATTQPGTTSTVNNAGNRSHSGDSTAENPFKIEDNAFTQAGRVTTRDAQGKDGLAKYDKGYIVGGEYYHHSTVQIHDYTQLKQTASIKAFGKDFDLKAEEIKDLTEGKKLSRELGDGDKKQKYEISFDKAKGTYTVTTQDEKNKEKKEENIKATNVKYGDSGLAAEGHLIASSRLGFLVTKADGSARKLDGMLKQVQDELAKNPNLKGLANDAHTLSYLAGTFAKFEKDKAPSIDTEALTKALPVLSKQLQADAQIRGDSKLSFKATDDAKRREQAQATNFAGFKATAGDKAPAAEAALKAQGFDTTEKGKGMTQFAGSAYAASGLAQTSLNDGSLKARILEAYKANDNKPIPLNLMVKMAADHSTDAKGSYDDSSRGADGALGTMLTLQGSLSGTRANEIQLLANGEKGLHTALDAFKALVEDTELKGKISVASLSVEGDFHANTQGGLLANSASLKAQRVEDQLHTDFDKLDAKDTDVTSKIADIAHAGQAQTVNLTFAGCNFGAVADQLGAQVQTAIQAKNDTAGATKVFSAVNVTSSDEKGLAKLDAADLRTDDSASQFIAHSNGKGQAIAVRRDQWSNDNTQTTHLKTFQVGGDEGAKVLADTAARSHIGDIQKAQYDHAASSKAPSEADRQRLNPPTTTINDRDDSGSVDESVFKTASTNIKKPEDETAEAARSEWERQNAVSA